MALVKQPVDINFSKGVDTKTDPFRLPIGSFTNLQNSIFTVTGRLTKRFGYGVFVSPPTSTFLTTYNSNLIAIGNAVNAYSQGSMTWLNKGSFTPLELRALPLIRSSTNQTYADLAVASNRSVCVVFTDNVPSGGSNVVTYKYAVLDQLTGQYIIAPAAIPSATVMAPRVFTLGNYFLIVFNQVITAVNHLRYISINSVTLAVGTATDISTTYTPVATGNFDGIVTNNILYIAWNGNDVGNAIRVTYIDATLTQHNTITFAGTNNQSAQMAVCADVTGSSPVIYIVWYRLSNTNTYMAAVNQVLSIITNPILLYAGATNNIAASAQNGILTLFAEFPDLYSYDSSILNHSILNHTYNIAGTTIVGDLISMLGVGISSKPFVYNGTTYLLVIYYSAYQPTYFLIDVAGNIVAKLAYSNGGTYSTTGLPSVSIINNNIYFAYLFKDLITAVNKTQGLVNSAGIYSQTGINMANIKFSSSNISASEIGNNLHLSGGFLSMYDGSVVVEHGFHLWPDYIEVVVSHSGGSMTVQDYYYIVTYEWTDAAGNIHRSAPSIPVKAASASFSGSTNSVTVNTPTLRLTAKKINKIKIVIYRWSTAQPLYYQCTSVSIPLLNATNGDDVQFVDTLADASILGNNLIYTTGGVIENIGAPAIAAMSLFKSRLMLLTAEDRNLVWFSKQVIQGVPVELSDLFTLYVAPTIGAQGSTGITTALAAMDDKEVFFKADAIYYLTGNGPDNTGSNNDFSGPFFITSTVGCANQSSVVFIPSGLMFQSDKGIWLLGRDLSTIFIGSPVEAYTEDSLVVSALAIPGTNQVRFMMDSGLMLMYDYYYNQWSTFINVGGVSSTLYQGAHTLINSNNVVLQETPDLYLDASTPVQMSVTTGWINLAGLQGFQRAYGIFILGTYLSPHKLSVSIAYDYNSAPLQNVIINPTNYASNYGSDTLWGGSSSWGGPSQVEQWRVFLQKQKCEAIQITISEIYDPSFGVVSGPGLTISGLNITIGTKLSRPKLTAAQSIG